MKLTDGLGRLLQQKIRDRMNEEKSLGDATEEINHLAYRLSEEGPRPASWVVLLNLKLPMFFTRSPKTQGCRFPGHPKFYRVIWALITMP